MCGFIDVGTSIFIGLQGRDQSPNRSLKGESGVAGNISLLSQVVTNLGAKEFCDAGGLIAGAGSGEHIRKRHRPARHSLRRGWSSYAFYKDLTSKHESFLRGTTTMKKSKDTLLAEMSECKSKHGNIFFSGRCETGGKIVMLKLKNKKNQYGQQIWQLLMTK